MDPFLLGLYAVSVSQKKNRLAKQAIEASQAAAAATKAEQKFELDKIRLQEDRKDDRERLKIAEKNKQFYMYRSKTDPSDIFTRPFVGPARHPDGYDIIGTKTGAESAFQPISEIIGGGGNAAGTPVYSFQGRVGTIEFLRQNVGGMVDLINPPQVGVLDKDGIPEIFSIEDMKVAMGASERKSIRVGDKIFSESDAAAAQAYGFEIGVEPVMEFGFFTSDGKRIGETKTVPLGAARTTSKQTFTMTIPAKMKDGEVVESATIMMNLTVEDLDKELEKRGLRQDQVTITKVETETGPKGTVVSEKVIERKVPADTVEKKTTFNARIGNIQYNNLTYSELEETAHEQGFDLSSISYVPVTREFKNGRLINETFGETNQPTGVKRHFGYIKDKDGEYHLVQAESKSQLNRMYGNKPGYEYGGVGDVNLSTGRLMGAIEEEDKEDVELTMSNGETVLQSQATPEQLMEAVTAAPVKVDSAGAISRTSSASITPTRSLAKDMNIPFRTDAGQFLGAPMSATPGDTLIKMHGKLTNDVIDDINSGDRTQEYVNQAGPAIVQAYRDIKTNQKAIMAQAGQAPQYNHMLESATKFIEQNYGQFFKIEGMKEFVTNSDTVRYEETTSKIIEKITKSSQAGSLPLAVQSSTNLDTIEDDNIVGNLAAQAKDGIVIPTYVPAPQANFAGNVLMPKLMAINGNSKTRAEESLFTFVSKKRGPDGEPITDENGIVEPSTNQPILDAFNNFNSKKSVIGNREVTYLDRFIAYANGEKGGLQKGDFQYFANTYIPAATNLTDAVEGVKELIYSFPAEFNIYSYTPPSVIEAAMANGLGEFQNTQSIKAFQANREVVRSADRGIGIANDILGTYYDPDGNVRPSTAVGGVILTIDGLEYLGREAFGAFQNLLGGNDSNAISEAYTSSIDTLKTQLKLETTGSKGDGVTGNTGREEIEAIIDEIAADVASKETEEERALAARQFHIVTLAYELSATIQGGTGGRTISDQDVALILRALRQNATASPQSQIAVIEVARNMMREIRTVANYLMSRDPREQAAFAVVQNLSAIADRGVYHRNISPVTVAARLSGTKPLDAIDETVILNSINFQRTLDGEAPYTSVDQITADDRANFTSRIQ